MDSESAVRRPLLAAGDRATAEGQHPTAAGEGSSFESAASSTRSGQDTPPDLETGLAGADDQVDAKGAAARPAGCGQARPTAAAHGAFWPSGPSDIAAAATAAGAAAAAVRDWKTAPELLGPDVPRTGGLDQCFQVRLPKRLRVAGVHPEWVTVRRPTPATCAALAAATAPGGAAAGFAAGVSGDRCSAAAATPVPELVCVNVRGVAKQQRDGIGSGEGDRNGGTRLGGPLRLSGADAVLALTSRRKPEALLACNLPVGCEDITALFFTIVSDGWNGLAAATVSSIVWLFIGVCFYWFAVVKYDDAVLYDGPPSEWILVGVLLALQGIPSLLDSAFTPWAQIGDLWALSAKVQPRLRARMRVALAFIVTDQLQPAFLISYSLYIVLFLCSGDLLNAFQNVVVLAFVAGLDTAVLKWFLQQRYGAGDEYRISLALLDVQPYDHGYDRSPPDGEEEEEEDAGNGEEWRLGDVAATLRSGEAGPEKKWRALVSGDAGLGLGLLAERGDYSRTGRVRVAAVVMNISIVSFAEVASKGVGELPGPVAAAPRYGPAGSGSGCRKERKMQSSCFYEYQAEWYLAGASDAQWLNDLDERNRVALLRHFYDKVERFPLRGADLTSSGLTAAHVEVVMRMLEHSPGVRRLKLSRNPRIGDEGVGHLAEALRHQAKRLAELWLAGVGMSERGAVLLAAALRRKPRSLPKLLVLGGEVATSEALAAVLGEIAASRPPGSTVIVS